MAQYEVGKRYRIVDIDQESAFHGDLPILKGRVVTVVSSHNAGASLQLEEPMGDYWKNPFTIYGPTLEEIPVLTINDFQVGMRVSVSGRVRGSSEFTGEQGTIITVNGSPYDDNEVGVEFDGKPLSGHDLAGRIKSRNGLWVHIKHLTILDQGPSLDAFELAWSDYLDQVEQWDLTGTNVSVQWLEEYVKDGFRAGWEARGGVK